MGLFFTDLFLSIFFFFPKRLLHRFHFSDEYIPPFLRYWWKNLFLSTNEKLVYRVLWKSEKKKIRRFSNLLIKPFNYIFLPSIWHFHLCVWSMHVISIKALLMKRKSPHISPSAMTIIMHYAKHFFIANAWEYYVLLF